MRSFIQTGYLLFVQRLQKGKKVPLRRRFRICRSITQSGLANEKIVQHFFFFIKQLEFPILMHNCQMMYYFFLLLSNYMKVYNMVDGSTRIFFDSFFKNHTNKQSSPPEQYFFSFLQTLNE